MVIRIWLALAVLCAGTARGAGPSYSAAGIVNASNFAGGPFAPNSVISIFGTNLARSTHALAAADLVPCSTGRCLPTEMNYVHVYVQNQPAPLLFVSEGQVNFLISSLESAGTVVVRVANESNSGPEIPVTLVDAAPALFSMTGGYVIATDANGKLLTTDAPAHAGDIVVVYATGMGQTSPSQASGEIPPNADRIPAAALSSLKVTLNGTTVDPSLIKYAGVTPLSAGLYQINLELPKEIGTDPEIRVTAGNLTAQAGLKLPVR